MTRPAGAQTEFMDAFVANDELLPLLRDAGERRRVGTLLVYVDDMEQPLLGMPLSLPAVFSGLSEGEVFAVREGWRPLPPRRR